MAATRTSATAVMDRWRAMRAAMRAAIRKQSSTRARSRKVYRPTSRATGIVREGAWNFTGVARGSVNQIV